MMRLMMKRALSLSLLVLSLASAPLMAKDKLEQWKEETNGLYEVGSEDGSYSAIGLSMIGWGVGIAATAAIVAALVHQSHAKSSHS